MNAIILALLIPAYGPWGIPPPNASGLTSYGASGVSCFHDADNSVSLCVGTSDTLGLAIYGQNRTDDANSLPLAIHAENVSPFAAAAKTASDARISGGLDSKTVVFTPAGADPDGGGLCTAADTVTVTVDGTANVCTYTTYCAAGCTTRALAAAALAGCIDAFAGVGASVGTQVGGVASTVGVTADPRTISVILSQNDASCTAISNGTDGCVVIKAQGFSPVFMGTDAGGFLNFGTTCGTSFVGLKISQLVAQSQVGGTNIVSSAGTTTAGTMTYTGDGSIGQPAIKSYTLKYSWTNAMVTALGASPTGNISVVTLPAKTRVKNVYVVIDTACTNADSLTVSVGRTGADYIDYIVASDAKAVANTVYGDAAAERGTNLTGYDLPSYAGTTTLYARFVSGAANLSTVTTCTGHVDIETELVF